MPPCECDLEECTHLILDRLRAFDRCPLPGDWKIFLKRQADPVRLCRSCASQAGKHGRADLDRTDEARLMEL